MGEKLIGTSSMVRWSMVKLIGTSSISGFDGQMVNDIKQTWKRRTKMEIVTLGLRMEQNSE